jgi:hypothetical protein
MEEVGADMFGIVVGEDGEKGCGPTVSGVVSL